MQVIGHKKCKKTQKLERFLKERSISYQFINIHERTLSHGELTNIIKLVDDIAQLLNTESKAYKKRAMDWLDFDIYEELYEDNTLLLTPILRDRSTICIGSDETCWQQFIQ